MVENREQVGLIKTRLPRVLSTIFQQLVALGKHVFALASLVFDSLNMRLGNRRMRQTRPLVRLRTLLAQERGDVPGWVLVVLMTTGLVTAIWAIAAPKLNLILKNSLDSMSNIR